MTGKAGAVFSDVEKVDVVRMGKHTIVRLQRWKDGKAYSGLGIATKVDTDEEDYAFAYRIAYGRARKALWRRMKNKPITGRFMA